MEHIVKSTLLHKLHISNLPKLYARAGVIKKIPTSTSKNFFTDNHIQGWGPSSISYGLYVGNQLVAVGSFMKDGYNMQLIRYATSGRVVGGLSKICSTIFKEYKTCTTITTFADKRWSTGESYVVAGFTETYHIPRDYYYVVGSTRFHKFGFRHKHLKQKLTVYDKGISEVANCRANGIYRIFDCGKIRFLMSKSCFR